MLSYFYFFVFHRGCYLQCEINDTVNAVLSLGRAYENSTVTYDNTVTFKRRNNAIGFDPVIAGLKEDVEKIWRKLKRKMIANGKIKRKLPADRSLSTSHLDELARMQSRTTDVAQKLAKFKAIDSAARAAETEDVFSPLWKPPKFDKNDPKYGRPKEGSLTEKRGIAAGLHIAKEIIQLCEVIDENGYHNKSGTVTITFGELFSIYVYISDKVVGMLLRARKHGIVDFQGEILYQRRDEKVPITLLKPLNEIREAYSQSMDPAYCLRSLN